MGTRSSDSECEGGDRAGSGAGGTGARREVWAEGRERRNVGAARVEKEEQPARAAAAVSIRGQPARCRPGGGRLARGPRTSLCSVTRTSGVVVAYKEATMIGDHVVGWWEQGLLESTQRTGATLANQPRNVTSEGKRDMERGLEMEKLLLKQLFWDKIHIP